MTTLIESTQARVESSDSILGFRTKSAGPGSVPTRYLTLNTRPAYAVGCTCDTCPLYFERMRGAEHKVSPQQLSQLLRDGIQTLGASTIKDLKSMMPPGDYLVLLIDLCPQTVTLGGENDYFSAEQREVWDLDSFWGLPHHPKVEYYRVPTPPVAEGGELFQFIVPMMPKAGLCQETIGRYRMRLEQGHRPTSIALSLLDVRQPTKCRSKPAAASHWCLVHYLLDGHHKTNAASLAKRPITIVAFLAVTESLATTDQLEMCLQALSRETCP